MANNYRKYYTVNFRYVESQEKPEKIRDNISTNYNNTIHYFLKTCH